MVRYFIKAGKHDFVKRMAERQLKATLLKMKREWAITFLEKFTEMMLGQGFDDVNGWVTWLENLIETNLLKGAVLSDSGVKIRENMRIYIDMNVFGDDKTQLEKTWLFNNEI